MLEIEQSISTWPQLASSVITGGGLAASVSRRILLSENVMSGRFYSDFETIAADPSDLDKVSYHKDQDILEADYNKLKSELNAPTQDNQHSLSENELDQLIHDVLLAPSAANNQPWTWIHKNAQLFLFHNTSRGKSYWDQEHIAAALSLGCAIENLKISASALGLEMKSNLYYDNLGNADKHLGHFWFERSNNEIPADDLHAYIGKRRTNRLNIDSIEIDSSDLQLIRQFGDGTPFNFIVLEDEQIKQEIGVLLGELEQIRLLNPNGHRDFVNEIRWSPEEAETKKDGIDIDTINLTATERAGFTISKNSEVIQKLRKWEGGSGFGDIITKGIKLSPALVIMYGADLDNKTKLNAGELFERLWLTLAKLSLEMHPLTSIAVLLNVAKMASSTISENEREKLNTINDKLIGLLGIPDQSRFYMAFRLFKGDNSPVKSLRLNKETSFIN